MNIFSITAFILIIFSCSTKKVVRTSLHEPDCKSVLSILKKDLLSSCPISEGPQEVIEYLEKFSGYYRNKNFDFGNGSIRFNAKNATIYGYPVLADKSLFLLNYAPNKNGYESWLLFQAVYFFEKKEDKDAVLKKMEKALKKDLNLIDKTNYTLLNEPYKRYYLPCGSGFNFKHGESGDKFLIDILWVPDITR